MNNRDLMLHLEALQEQCDELKRERKALQEALQNAHEQGYRQGTMTMGALTSIVLSVCALVWGFHYFLGG